MEFFKETGTKSLWWEIIPRCAKGIIIYEIIRANKEASKAVLLSIEYKLYDTVLRQD